jgi:multiple sugar transport system permease protein
MNLVARSAFAETTALFVRREFFSGGVNIVTAQGLCHDTAVTFQCTAYIEIPIDCQRDRRSKGALMFTYPTFLLPFATWVLIGYFRSIPVELEEAAMIDGASRFYAFWKITLPLAAPAVLSVTLFAFTNAWNEFLFAFVFITKESQRTLPVGLQSMVVGDILPWGELMAAALFTAIPVAVLYIYAQRFLVEGLTIGAVKG